MKLIIYTFLMLFFSVSSLNAVERGRSQTLTTESRGGEILTTQSAQAKDLRAQTKELRAQEVQSHSEHELKVQKKNLIGIWDGKIKR